MNMWAIVGVGSLFWSFTELLSGKAWLHREVSRDSEPTAYWSTVLFWLLLGISCLVPVLW